LGFDAGFDHDFGVAARQIALMSIYFAGNTRLPMVQDGQSAARMVCAFAPALSNSGEFNTICGLITLAFSLASLVGVKEQEAFQLQDNAATTFYALIYMCSSQSRWLRLSGSGLRPRSG